MELKIDLTKSLHENASAYYDQAKKIKKKIEGARKALVSSKLKLTAATAKEKPVTREQKRSKQWFEQYHWLRTRNGLLVIAGRDATENESIVKKRMQAKDLFFHADIQGAAATLLIGGQAAGPEDREDAARLAAIFSKAWQAGLGAVDVYSVLPDQVKTAAKSGEFLAKGSFVIEGKREWYRKVPMEIGAAVVDGGPVLVVSGGTRLIPGEVKKSDLAKMLVKRLGGAIDDWVSLLPQGGAFA